MSSILKQPSTYYSDDPGFTARLSPLWTTNAWKPFMKEEGSKLMPQNIHSREMRPNFRGNLFWWTSRGERSKPESGLEAFLCRHGRTSKANVLDLKTLLISLPVIPDHLSKACQTTTKRGREEGMNPLKGSVWAMEQWHTSSDSLYGQTLPWFLNPIQCMFCRWRSWSWW